MSSDLRDDLRSAMTFRDTDDELGWWNGETAIDELVPLITARIEAARAEIRGGKVPYPGDPTLGASCSDCGRLKVWSRPDGCGSWMCPRCVIERMDRGECDAKRQKNLADHYERERNATLRDISKERAESFEDAALLVIDRCPCTCSGGCEKCGPLADILRARAKEATRR